MNYIEYSDSTYSKENEWSKYMAGRDPLHNEIISSIKFMLWQQSLKNWLGTHNYPPEYNIVTSPRSLVSHKNEHCVVHVYYHIMWLLKNLKYEVSSNGLSP